MTNTCPFCDTTQQFRCVYESSDLRVIYPKSPACKYHLLITPKRHIETLDQYSVVEAQQLIGLVKQLRDVVSAHDPDFIGYNTLSNNGGTAVNQHVMHSHMHVFLRTKNDPNNTLDRPKDSASPPQLTDTDLQIIKTLKEWLS